jgi:PAS domain S-box-containing protein
MVLLGVSILPSARAQDLFVKHLTAEDGLPTSNIRSVLNDANGFLWCGTEEGLLRFDGYTFTVIDNRSVATGGLPDNRVDELFQDRAGKLWIGTALGLTRHDPGKGTFRTYYHDRILYGRIQGMFETRDASLWVLTDSTLCRYEPRSDSFVGYPYSDQLAARAKYDKTMHEKTVVEIGTLLWCCMNGNLLLLDRATGSIRRIGTPGNAREFFRNNAPQDVAFFREIHAETSRSLLITNRTGLYRYTVATGAISLLLPYHSECRSSLSANGILWTVHSDGNFARYDIAKAAYRVLSDPAFRKAVPFHFRHTLYVDRAGVLWFFREGFDLLQHNPQTNITRVFGADVIPANMRVSMITEDRNGCLWLANAGLGLTCLEKHRARFSPVRFGQGTPARDYNGNTRCIAMLDPGTALVGTLAGLYKYRLEAPGALTQEPIFSRAMDSIVCKHPVWSIDRDSLGRFWIAVGLRGVFVFDPATGRHRSFQVRDRDGARLSNNNVRTILVAGDTAWIGTWNGLNAIRIRDVDCASNDPVRIRQFHHVPGDSTSLSNGIIFALFRDRSLRLWIGTENGLNLFHSDKGTFEHFFEFVPGKTKTNSNNIRAIHEDRLGRLWLGTHSGGLLLFQSNPDTRETYTTENGLPSNIIYSILEDGADNLWLGTHRGLCRFNWRTKETRNFREVDGLPNAEFNTGACLKLPDRRLLFAGVQGFTVFDPAHIYDLFPPPPIALTRLLVVGKETPFDRSGLTLSHDKNFITFEFAALSFVRNKENQYMYRMEGVDPDWVFCGTRRIASYSNLAPGEYLFHVRASNCEGIWNNTGTALRITIRRPWWATAWAYAGYGFLLIATIIFVGFGHRRSILRKEREQTAVRENELRFAAAEAQSRALQAENERKGAELLKAKQLQTAYDSLARAHDHLKTAQDRLHTVVSSAPIVLFALDREGRFTLSEGRGLEALGLTSGQVIGQSIHDVYRDFPAILDFAARALRGEHVSIVNEISGLWFDTRATPMYDEEGALIGIIGVATNVTEEQRSREQIVKLSLAVEQSPGMVIITDTCGVVEYVNAKFTEISGYTLEEMIGKTPRVLKSGATSGEEYSTLWNMILSGREWRGEMHNIAKDGREYWVSASISPMKNTQGVITHFIGLQEDITLRKEAEHALALRTEALKEKHAEVLRTQEQLSVQQKLASLGRMTAGIAHEINNPLNFVHNFSALSAALAGELLERFEQAREGIPSGEVDDIISQLYLLKNNTEKISEHSDRAGMIIANMMAHARVQSGERLPADINALVSNAVNTAVRTYQGPEPGIDVIIEKRLDPMAGQVTVWAKDIDRVVGNLVNNAIYAMKGALSTASDECRPSSGDVVVPGRPHGNGAVPDSEGARRNGYIPTLLVTTIRHDAHVSIHVRDNGPGVPEDILPKIFQPFFTTKPAGAGTGLGLSMSYDIVVNGHGGALECYSPPRGAAPAPAGEDTAEQPHDQSHGTEFILTLPVTTL